MNLVGIRGVGVEHEGIVLDGMFFFLSREGQRKGGGAGLAVAVEEDTRMAKNDKRAGEGDFAIERD